MLQAYRSSHMTFFRASVLNDVPGVIHGFSTRRGDAGDLRLGGELPPAGDDRARFLAAVGLAGWPLGRLEQIHSNIVHAVEDHAFANQPPRGDAAYTTLPGIALGVMTADCAPILIAEARGRAIAVAHAGWRGISEGVVRRTVDGLVSHAGLATGDLVAAVGPHIGVCCLEVGEEVFEWFADPDVFVRRPDRPKPHLSLAAAARKQLLAAGLSAARIQVSGLCTRCRGDLFFSYRREGADAGRMLAVIAIEPPPPAPA